MDTVECTFLMYASIAQNDFMFIWLYHGDQDLEHFQHISILVYIIVVTKFQGKFTVLWVYFDENISQYIFEEIKITLRQ